MEDKNCIHNTDACMEIKGDIQENQATDIQHKSEVCPPLWFRDAESNKNNLQQAAVLRQQMPEVHNGHPLAGGHKELGTVGRSLTGEDRHPDMKAQVGLDGAHPQKANQQCHQVCTEVEPTEEEEPKPSQEQLDENHGRRDGQGRLHLEVD